MGRVEGSRVDRRAAANIKLALLAQASALLDEVETATRRALTSQGMTDCRYTGRYEISHAGSGSILARMEFVCNGRSRETDSPFETRIWYPIRLVPIGGFWMPAA